MQRSTGIRQACASVSPRRSLARSERWVILTLTAWFDAGAAACTDHDHVRVADLLPPRVRSSMRRRWFRDQLCHQLLRSSLVFRARPMVRRLVNLVTTQARLTSCFAHVHSPRVRAASSSCKPAVMRLRTSASLSDSAPRGLVAETRSADGEHLHHTTGVGSEDARCPVMRSPLNSPLATHPRGPVDLPASGPPQEAVRTSRALQFDFIDPRCLRSV